MLWRASNTRTPATIASVMVAGVLGVLALRLWVVEPVTVSSDSMEPTVQSGETVLLMKVSPTGGPLSGRIVAFEGDDERILVKRVAAEGGQTIAVRDGLVYVDGDVVPEPYVDSASTDGTFFPLTTVPEGHIFVLGDNRASSVDSRDFGPIPTGDVTATVLTF
ncbi:signal peptidase I [Planctomonas psychrotolerans]|uniref:signal peptidase I n=1 Tax=Planctomonas psychrotolerans TaxID=2528712 RepID=UPI001D0CFFE1|nr:signal peptidase I [Planctomonas psychrotolerans]